MIMYTPDCFAETDRDVLHAFIEQHSFATLVSPGGAETAAPEATHLPLLLDRSVGERGQLIGHFARENPHWQYAADQSVVAIFHGPHTYISPTWYEDRQVVPTWNYVAVHVEGTLRVEHDHARLLEIIRRTVDTYEAPLPQPWSIAAPGSELIDKLLGGIVGFTIDIEQIQGKWKLNQNQTPQRRERVIRALEAHGGHDRQEIASLMKARYT
jgi:transcriptional regulator